MAVAFSVLAGCAGRRLHDGVFRSEHGFRVTVPGPAWNVVNGSRAELELRRADGGAGVLAHATRPPEAARRDYGLLERHPLLGPPERATPEEGEAGVAGGPAAPRGGGGRAPGG